MSKRNGFLVDQLRLLIREWGYEQVASALELVRIDRASRSFGKQQRGRSKKPTAVDLVDRLVTLETKRFQLDAIGKKFDDKRFLPTVGDIREFLSMMGAEPVRIKDRIEGFRKLLPRLEELPVERLEQLASGASYSGPARLGPLSDAIRSAGETVQRVQEPPKDEE